MFMVPTSGAHSADGFSVLEKNGELWVKLYNATASDIAAGTCVYRTCVQSDTGLILRGVALVNDALRHVIGVVDGNCASSQSGSTQTPSGVLPATGWGYVKVRGRISATTASITTVKGDSLVVTAGAIAAGGAALPYTDTSFGLANESSGPLTTHDIFLFGREFKST